MNYPLIKRCFPNLEINLQLMKAWFPVIRADDLERELEKAATIMLHTDKDSSMMCSAVDGRKATDSALLIGIEPIKKETAENLLRELVSLTSGRPLWELDDIVKRAKALLERGDK